MNAGQRDPLEAAIAHLRSGAALVEVEVRSTRGSTPREAGARCWVARDAVLGSIGGGRLEFCALEIAQLMLGDATAGSPRVERWVLGATLGQCCGGVVELGFERLGPAAIARLEADSLEAASRRRLVVVYGAGHVATALARVLATLPFRLSWFDSREACAVDGVTFSEAPEHEAALAPDGAWHVVMTHDHDLDLRIVEAILRRDRFGFCGVIGSRTKGARFRNRLLARGFDAATVARLECPIGDRAIASKLPAAIAIAIAARLLELDAVAAAAGRPAAAAR